MLEIGSKGLDFKGHFVLDVKIGRASSKGRFWTQVGFEAQGESALKKELVYKLLESMAYLRIPSTSYQTYQ